MVPKAHIAEAALQKCPQLALLPDRDLGPSETQRLWGADRIEYADCATRHNALVDAIGVALK
jgi:hypothetical protein